MKFKVDDKVYTRDWEQLLEQYGEASGMIQMPLGFTKEMNETLAGKELTVSTITEDGIIFLKDYPQFNFTEEMLRYPDEEITYFTKWAKRVDVESYEKANDFYDETFDRCAIGALKIFPEINQEYAWDLLRYLYLPAKCSEEYLESEEYRKFKETKYGFIARAAELKEENRLEDFAQMLSTAHEVYDTLFPVKGTPDEKIENFLINSAGYEKVDLGDDYWNAIKANDEYHLTLYTSEQNGVKRVVVFSELWNNEVMRSIYLAIAKAWNAFMSPELMKGILEKDQEQLYRAVDNIFITFEKDKEGLEVIRNIHKLGGFFESNQKAIAADRVRSLTSEIEDLERQIIERQAKRRDYRLKEIGLKTIGFDENFKMFLGYVETIKDKLTVLKVENDRIIGAFLLPLTYWSEEEWEAVKDNYRGGGYVQSLFRDIFGNRKYTLIIEQGFVMYFGRECAIARWGEFTGKHGMPNPHMQRYDCWGDNKRHILNAMGEFDLTMAFGQVMSAVAGINISDSPVFSQLKSYFENGNYRKIPCLKDNETGELISIDQYRQKIEREED